MVDYAKRYFEMHPDACGGIPENTLSLGVCFEESMRIQHRRDFVSGANA